MQPPPKAAPPFALEHQLTQELDDPSRVSLPGHPSVLLDDKRGLWDCLDDELWPDDLERISHRLWWMTTQSSANITPLHRQRVKRRMVVVTEDPRLHLVWIYDRIFVKPLPRYLGSYRFWQDYLCDSDGNGKTQDADDGDRTRRIRKAALGYLRTYRHLVRYESDFRMAQDPSLCLVPSAVTWEQFSRFAADLGRITDRQVSGRYAYGEIRLTRLNFYAPLVLGRAHFHRIDYQYGDYFARFYGPVLFVIGGASVVLSGLQVIVSADATSERLLSAALWLSVAVMVVFCIIFLSLSLILVYKVASEWKFAVRERLRLTEERRAEEAASEC
ncbi:hypothetical protein VTK73DRAFT_1397 [Phialemonium thermophilum]|uniref:Uncharacterized protein n=1 Tax=Phialemonium thermophilum TaxID=223376 RepID=A0ABR3VTH5_9PEZI